MSDRILAVLLEDGSAGPVMARAASLAAEAPGAALRFLAVIERGRLDELEFTDDSRDAVARLEEEAGMLFEAARTVARRRHIEPETAVVQARDRDLAELIAAQASDWGATAVVLGEPPRGFLRRRIGRSTADGVEHHVASAGMRVVRVLDA